MKSTVPIPAQLRSKLWKHQIEAIEFAYPYLRGTRSQRTALIRLPTGTGKTGVIATLAVVLPPAAWTLILTPWRHLCDQMLDDVKEEFWKARNWKARDVPRVTRLYPSTIEAELEASDKQVILIATFASLIRILKEKPSQYGELRNKIAEIFVDEGHYEPAVEWGEAVKRLAKPTLLLTATPYRNDLKLFRVLKEDVYSFTHKQAVRKKIIRALTLQPLTTSEPRAGEVAVWCREFAGFWKKAIRYRLPKNARAIICCSTMATVRRVATLLRNDHGLDAVGIHERFGGAGRDWLLKDTPKPEKVNFEIWVHQNKLTEGLDDSRFCVLGILNRIRNDRKLIQQIGRVLRRGRRAVGHAWVLYSNDLAIKNSWENYLKFESLPELVDPSRYKQVLQDLLNSQPAMEYFGGRFRSRFQSDSPAMPDEVRLLPTALVRRVKTKFDLDRFTAATADFLLLEDRIFLGPTAEHFTGPNHSRLWVYAVFTNSRLLKEHAQYEIRLGATAAVLHGDLLFMADTEGAYPTEYLTEFTAKLGRDEFGRIFNEASIPKEVSSVNPWPQRYSVRRMAVYSDNLGDTPAQLRDSIFSCAAVRATTRTGKPAHKSRRHYVGFHRGRLSEQMETVQRDEFSLTEYVNWTAEIAKLINDHRRTIPDFFSRYLSPVPAPASINPRFLVFNFFEGDVELQDENEHTVALVESVVQLTKAPNDQTSCTSRFDFTLRYIANSSREQVISGAVIYDPKSCRFRFKSDALNSQLFARESTANDGLKGVCSYLNSEDECFSVALEDGDTFYNAQEFYKINYSYAEVRFDRLLVSQPELANADEKGSRGARRVRFDANSVFGVVANLGSSGIVLKYFGQPEFLFCDDLQTEVADFVCADFTNHKIVLIHAKSGKRRIVSASALHEVVSQAQKNLSVLTRGPARPKHLCRWDRSSFWSGTRIRRWQVGNRSLPVHEALWSKIKTDIIDHPAGVKEVWIVLGHVLQKQRFLEHLRDVSQHNAETGQVVYLLSALEASCSQLSVRLRVFCH